MLKKTNSIITLMILLSLSSFSIEKIDSLKNILKNKLPDSLRITTTTQLGSEYLNVDNEMAIFYHTSALKLSEKTKNELLIASCLGEIAWDNAMLGNYEKSIDLYNQSMGILESFLKRNPSNKKGKLLLSACMGNIGTMYYSKTNYTKALEYFLKCSDYRNEINDKEGVAVIMGNIALIYNEQKQYEKAIEFHTKALKINNELKYEYGIARCHANIASVYLNEFVGKYNTSNEKNISKLSFYHFNEALKIANKLNNKTLIGTINSNMGILYFYLGENSKALECYNIGLTINEDISNKNGIVCDLLNIGELYTKTGKFKEAELFLLRSLALSDSIGAIDNTMMAHKNLYLLYDTTSQTQKALYHFKKFISIKDTLNSDENNRNTLRIQAEYEYKTQKKLDEAEHKNAVVILEEKEKKQFAISIIIGFGLVTVLIFSLLLFNRFKITQKQKLVIELKEKETQQQKHLVEEKHKEITDSINYAERIQRSFLATKDLLDENLHDYFVFFQPKDIVSGDFYWAEKLNNNTFALVTADSTGHGVPGAIMSLLNVTSLEMAIKEGLTQPAEILNHTRKSIIERLKKDGSDDGGKDGMDASLICFDFKNHKITYSAANNPVWIVRGHEIIELAPDKMPIGKHDRDTIPFCQHDFTLQKGDVVYTITDGMSDQFGGPKGKKFMYKQLKELLISIAHLPVSIQKETLKTSLNNWKGNLEQVDDVCVIGVRV